MVHESEPRKGLCAAGAEPAWDSGAPLSFCPSTTHTFSLSQNKERNLKKREEFPMRMILDLGRANQLQFLSLSVEGAEPGKIVPLNVTA